MTLVFPSVIPIMSWDQSSGVAGVGGRGYMRSLQKTVGQMNGLFEQICGFLNGDMSLRNRVMGCRAATQTELI